MRIPHNFHCQLLYVESWYTFATILCHSNYFCQCFQNYWRCENPALLQRHFHCYYVDILSPQYSCHSNYWSIKTHSLIDCQSTLFILYLINKYQHGLYIQEHEAYAMVANPCKKEAAEQVIYCLRSYDVSYIRNCIIYQIMYHINTDNFESTVFPQQWRQSLKHLNSCRRRVRRLVTSLASMKSSEEKR